jgi:hypothetical protein
MTTNDQQKAALEYRETARIREEAHRRSHQETVRRVHQARKEISNLNFGQAADLLDNLLEELPWDNGAQTVFPMFDRHCEKLSGNR